MDIRSTLEQTGLFSDLDDEAFARLVDRVEAVRFAPGDYLVHQGDVGDALHVICEGEFQIIRESDDGDVVLARVGAGSFVGEQALLPGGTGRRNASARAATPATALRVGRELFQEALAANHPLKEHLRQVGEQQQRHNLLAQTQLFRSLPPDSDLGRHGEELRFDAGETILREGDVADRVYLLLSGSASVFRTVDGEQSLVAKVQAGQCVGELGLVSREPRAATVVADEPVLAFSIDGAHFVALHESSPELREYVSTLEGVYRLPRRGLVTQHSGRFQDQECLTTIYHLDDGRRLVVARTVGSQVTNLQQTGAEAAKVATFGGDGVERELRLSPSGTLIGLTSVGSWDGLPEAMQLALDGARLTDDQLQRFRDGGNLEAEVEEPDSRMICMCMQVQHRTLLDAIAGGCDNLEGVQQRTRCGTVCGACVPWVLEMLGGRGFTPAEVVEEIEVASDIRSFRLRPRSGEVLPHQPGQHVVVKADIDGDPVQRAYTLTSRSGIDDFYEVTVKREPKGVFSRWLFDRREPDATIYVSDPRGEMYWHPSGGHVVGLVGGIGVTMGLAIWRAAQCQECADTVHIDYSVSHPHQFAYADELRERAGDRFSVNLRVTKDQGRLGADELAELVRQRPGADFFLCGPDSYLDATSDLLRAAGVAEQRIHVEHFTHAGGPIAAAEEEEPVDLPGPSADFLYDRSEQPHERRTDRLRAAVAKAVWRVESALVDDWQLFGRSVNPICYLGHRLQAIAGIDPKLPYDPLAGIGLLTRGIMAQSRDVFARLDRRYGPNWERARRARAEGRPLHPHTPDGDTITCSPPSVKLLGFGGEHAVETGYQSGFRLLMPFYVVRGRQALRTFLSAPTSEIDRGPLPFHYHLQAFGDWGCPHSEGRRAGGLLFGPMHENLNWKEDRERSVRVFSPRAVETLLPNLDDAVRKVCAQLLASFDGKTASREVDLGALLNHVADAVFVRATLGDLDLAEFGRIGRVARAAQGVTASHANRFMLGFPWNRRALDDGNAEMRELLAQLAEEIRERERSGLLSPGQRRLPLVQLLLAENDGAPFGLGRLNALVHPSISAHETTKSFLSWSFYELLANPDLAPAVLEEIADYRATHGCRLAAPSDYNLRPHTLAHLMETARLHVPAAAIFRWSSAAGVVPPDPDTGIGGFSYPANALILCSPGGANTNPQVHDAATEFRPARFFDGVSEKQPVREQGRRVWKNAQEMELQFSLVPFGAGVGQCVGRHYNLLENFAILDTLMSHFTFELVDPGEVESQELLVWMPAPGSMMARMRPRGGAR
ncbi:MAG TPA: cytochrome P450 [Thermoanaerobaculia bacterium]|nr:cytochrome P450 [Thermoanaerobaculia bacterium]